VPGPKKSKTRVQPGPGLKFQISRNNLKPIGFNTVNLYIFTTDEAVDDSNVLNDTIELSPIPMNSLTIIFLKMNLIVLIN